MILELVVIIIYTLYFGSFPYLPNILDKKTRYKNDKFFIGKNIDIKYILMFMFINVFCFLFLDKIRESRKISYYKDRVSNFEQNHMLKYDYATSKYYNEYVKMKRYLKMKRLKK